MSKEKGGYFVGNGDTAVKPGSGDPAKSPNQADEKPSADDEAAVDLDKLPHVAYDGNGGSGCNW